MSNSTTTTTTTGLLPRLPPELWLLIFRFAISAPIVSPFEFAHYYEPFQSRRHEITTALFNAALRDKCAITSVCRQWHALAGDMRYEDIRIGPRVASLYTVLTEPAPVPAATIVGGDSGTGTITARHCVRRAVLPFARTEKPTCYAQSALALLALLPHLEVLVRPPLSIPLPQRLVRVQPGLPIPTTLTATPALPTLRRLEWAFEMDCGVARTSAGTSGMNLFFDMLIAAPSLHELVLTRQMPYGYTTISRQNIHLRALRALRLQDGAGTCWFIAKQTTYWELPVLENVVVEGRGDFARFRPFWEKFGGQVRVLELELGGGGWGGMGIKDVSKIVAFCPALEELNLWLAMEGYLSWIPKEIDEITWSCTHHTLQRIGIRVDAVKWPVERWMKIVDYMGMGKFGKGCLALRQVVLYVRPEQVEVTLQNPRFHEIREALLLSGTQLLLHSVNA